MIWIKNVLAQNILATKFGDMKMQNRNMSSMCFQRFFHGRYLIIHNLICNVESLFK